MKKFILFLLLISSVFISAQQKSIQREQSDYYQSLQLKTDSQFDSLRSAENNLTYKNQHAESWAAVSSTCVLNKKVFGWHPYWNGSTYTSYQWNLLSDLCYFDYTTSPSTGNNTNASFAWNTASVVTTAKANGTKIHICATMFSGHSTFWASTTAQNTFINNIIALLNNRQGNGVNIDFEGMGSSDKVPFTNFITNLNAALNAANPNYQLSMALYAVDWSGVFDMPALSAQADFFTIMGYDYYYSGSATAGPTAPLYNFQPTYNYTLPKSITYYIKQGAPASKLLLGLPYYGREWETTTNLAPSATTGSFTSSRTLSYINNNSATYTTSVKKWEGNCYSPWYVFQVSGAWRQCWIDDIYSMSRKYDLVNQRGLGGIGIWALGYDNGMTAYWNLIQDKFSNCAPIVCNDSLFDMGGPTRNYYDNEKYNYTLSAPTGSFVQLKFKNFSTELNKDTLWLYNGPSITSSLIGVYTGTNSPGTVTSTGQSLTLRFKSDAGVNTFGFKAVKTCTAPTIVTYIQNNETFNEISIYPNPTTGDVNVYASNMKQVIMYDYTGRLIYSEKNIISDEKKLSLKKLNLSPGIYFLQITFSNNSALTRKIIYKD
ncbi:MAG: T9SS type A sorting domain-containing protein [Bacteroidetes bacterium]|nr:T9SS type A sorting domain-containing protein [Bacteroidota bacterium]